MHTDFNLRDGNADVATKETRLNLVSLSKFITGAPLNSPLFKIKNFSSLSL